MADSAAAQVSLERRRKSRARRRANSKKRQREARRNERLTQASVPSSPPSSPNAPTSTSTSTQTQTETCPHLDTIYHVPAYEYNHDRKVLEQQKELVAAFRSEVTAMEDMMSRLREENLQLQINQAHLRTRTGTNTAPHVDVVLRLYERKLADAWRINRRLFTDAEREAWAEDGVPAGNSTAAWVASLQDEVTNTVGFMAWWRIESDVAELDTLELREWAESMEGRGGAGEGPERTDVRQYSEAEVENEREIRRLELLLQPDRRLMGDTPVRTAPRPTVGSRPCRFARRNGDESEMEGENQNDRVPQRDPRLMAGQLPYCEFARREREEAGMPACEGRNGRTRRARTRFY